MDETRYILAGSFIDGCNSAGARNIFLAVTNGTITAIGPRADLPDLSEETIDDYSHCTLVPALVDCSVYLLRSPSVAGGAVAAKQRTGPADMGAMLARHISYCHAYGVLGVADGDGVQDQLDRSPLITIRSTGDFLKIYYSAQIGEEQPPGDVRDQYALGQLLQRRGERKAVVVANGRQQVAEALAAGCDAIEQGYAMGQTNLKSMADKGVLWIPSVLRAKNGVDSSGSGGDVCCRFSQRYVAPGEPVPGAEAYWKRMLEEQLAQLHWARQFGVQTAIGTGAGSPGILHGESVVEEMKLFIRAGYSLEETIRCASENGARFFDMAHLGALTVGRRATFLLTRGTVKQLPRKLSYLENIYIDGLPCSSYRKTP